eukprot:RCo029327
MAMDSPTPPPNPEDAAAGSAGAGRGGGSRREGMFVGPYLLVPTLGKGTTGKVKLCVHQSTRRTAAVKIVRKALLEAKPGARQRLEREISILKQLRHPNVMRIYDLMQTGTHIFVVLEYLGPLKYTPAHFKGAKSSSTATVAGGVFSIPPEASSGAGGGELFEYLLARGFLSPEEAFGLFLQLLMGVEYLHSLNICHRDLKLENLLLDRQQTVKIADFGMAEVMPANGLLRTSCGSPHYACPEIVRGEVYHGVHADLWSMGVILFALVTGSLPFDRENLRDLFEAIKAADYAFPRDLPEPLVQFIGGLLQVRGEDRLPLREMPSKSWFRKHLVGLPPDRAQAWAAHRTLLLQAAGGIHSGGSAPSGSFTPIAAARLSSGSPSSDQGTR